MSNTLELPPINVNAVRDAFSPPRLGLSPPMPNPAHVAVFQHMKRMEKYGEGYWREMFIAHMEEMNETLKKGWRLMPTAGFLFDMNKIPLADKYMSSNPYALSRDAVKEAINGWGYGKSIAEARELSGGVLSAAAAYGHYFSGGGADVVTNINRLGLNFSGQKMPPALESALNTAMVGSSPINLAKVPYSTWADSWVTGSWLGSITLRIEGAVHKNHDGGILFNGVVRAYNDTFDFNASTHRAGIGEVATSVVRELGKVMSPRPFQIVIQGEMPISIQR